MFMNIVQIVFVAGVSAATIVQMTGLGIHQTDADKMAGAMAPNETQIKQQAYVAERQQILQEIATLTGDKRWAEVQVAAKPWLDQEDPDLLNAYDSAREQDLVSKLRKVPASEVDKNLDFYTTLVTLKPDNTRYQQKQDHYRGLAGQDQDLSGRVAAILCQGQTRAAAKLPTTAEVMSLDTVKSADSQGGEVLSLGLQVQEPDGTRLDYQANCLLGQDKSVILSDWMAR